jgi:predicted RNase H-like HicB family nuclease
VFGVDADIPTAARAAQPACSDGTEKTKEIELMANTYTAVTKKEGAWWIGWIEEIPGVNCQERTRKELLKSLRTTLKEALEFNRQDALEAAKSGYTEELVTV